MFIFILLTVLACAKPNHQFRQNSSKQNILGDFNSFTKTLSDVNRTGKFHPDLDRDFMAFAYSYVLGDPRCHFSTKQILLEENSSFCTNRLKNLAKYQKKAQESFQKIYKSSGQGAVTSLGLTNQTQSEASDSNDSEQPQSEVSDSNDSEQPQSEASDSNGSETRNQSCEFQEQSCRELHSQMHDNGDSIPDLGFFYKGLDQCGCQASSFLKTDQGIDLNAPFEENQEAASQEEEQVSEDGFDLACSRLEGIHETPDVSYFADLDEDTLYLKEILEATRIGLIVGEKKDQKRFFNPTSAVTRAQAVTMIFKALMCLKKPFIPNFADMRIDEDPFKDVTLNKDASLNEWYVAPVALAKEYEIVSGRTDGTFGPNDPVTFGQLTRIIYTAVRLVYRENPAVVAQIEDKLDFEQGDSFEESDKFEKTIPFMAQYCGDKSPWGNVVDRQEGGFSSELTGSSPALRGYAAAMILRMRACLFGEGFHEESGVSEAEKNHASEVDAPPNEI